MSLRLARVVDTHPEDHSVDIVMHDDGSRHIGVQVLAIGATTNTGQVNLPRPTQPAQKWGQAETTDRDATAVCAMLGGTDRPIVVGFLYPQVNQMLFEDQNRFIWRHPSDVYVSAEDDGDTEFYHPSGTYIRIAQSAAHEDLTGKDFDKQWKIAKNTSKAVNLRIRVANAGVEKLLLTVDPSGNINLHHTGNLTTDTDGFASINIDGNATLHVGGNLTATVSGNLSATVDGNSSLSTDALDVTASTSTFNGNVAITGSLSVGSGAAISGGLTNNGTDVGDTHTHGGVDTGTGHTAPPD